MVAMDSWPPTSRYPQGHYVKTLGDIGDRETESEVSGQAERRPCQDMHTCNDWCIHTCALLFEHCSAASSFFCFSSFLLLLSLARSMFVLAGPSDGD